MAMLPCKKCLENNWEYKYQDGLVIATCKWCENEVIFETKLKKKETIQVGDNCRKCGNKIILKEAKFKNSKLKKPYYYNAYYYCQKCKTIYFSDKFKIINKNYEKYN